jgi:hypothetical protein
MTKPTKPPKFKAFEELTKQLLAIPKTELEKRMQRYEAAKRSKKKREG